MFTLMSVEQLSSETVCFYLYTTVHALLMVSKLSLKFTHYESKQKRSDHGKREIDKRRDGVALASRWRCPT